ncbi:MAG: hypothetical protein B6D64_12615 [Bacteroidetes bacterium 4484_276]|nr:MAG: hypothetical protein B6D64_12615 [Bacteroidetes bacterium 4484_276]
MKKAFCFIVVVFFCINISQAQSFPKVKVTLKNGQVVKGSKALISNQSIAFSSAGTPKTFPLSDVSLVESRKGSAGWWALGCGGGCLAVYALVLSSNDPAESGYENSELIPGVILLVGLSTGVGLLIGTLTDKYIPVYSSGYSSLINRFDLNLSSVQPNKYDPKKKWDLTLSYKF